MSDFMKPQVVFSDWYCVETTCGSEIVPFDDVGKDAAKEDFADFIEGEYLEHEEITGWGARLSAPGYTDCTSWSVYETEEKAKEHLREAYDVEMK
jgi:hypothetical protein